MRRGRIAVGEWPKCDGKNKEGQQKTDLGHEQNWQRWQACGAQRRTANARQCDDQHEFWQCQQLSDDAVCS
jgi:hypothetical protein